MDALFSVLIIFPLLGVFISGLFCWFYYSQKLRSALISAALWLTYSGYEGLMYARVLCTGECNIRVDLLLIYPLLLLFSLLPFVFFFIKRRRK